MLNGFSVSVGAGDDLLYRSQPQIIGHFQDSEVILDSGDNYTMLCDGPLTVEWYVAAPGAGEIVSIVTMTTQITYQHAIGGGVYPHHPGLDNRTRTCSLFPGPEFAAI